MEVNPTPVGALVVHLDPLQSEDGAPGVEGGARPQVRRALPVGDGAPPHVQAAGGNSTIVT